MFGQSLGILPAMVNRAGRICSPASRLTRLRRETPLSSAVQVGQKFQRCLSISRTVSRFPSGLRRPAFRPGGALQFATYYIIPILSLICPVPSWLLPLRYFHPLECSRLRWARYNLALPPISGPSILYVIAHLGYKAGGVLFTGP